MRRKKRSVLSLVLILFLLMIPQISSSSVSAGDGNKGRAKSTKSAVKPAAVSKTLDTSVMNTSVYTPPKTGLELYKTASVYGDSDSDGRQIFKIDIAAKAASNIVVTKKAADIILVFDNSSSLNGTMDKVTLEYALKAAAEKFIDNVVRYSSDSKIAVVNAKDKDTTYIGLTSVKTETDQQKILDAIQFSTKGNCAVEQGLQKAFEIYDGSDYDSARARIVILVTASGTGGPVMADAIQWSAILKGSHSAEIDPSSILMENSGGTDNYPMPELGCNAAVYSVGVFSTANKDINEYLWRVSSNSPSSAPVTENSYLPNGYYLTTDNTESLNDIFTGIAEQLGTTLKNAVVRDYIDPRFDIVDASGNILKVGDTMILGGNTGTIRSDVYGIYVDWPAQEIVPESAEGTVPAKDFNGSLYIKPKADFIGGNNVPTNAENITAVYQDNINIGSFPCPLVNVPFKIRTQNIQDYILLGESIPKDKPAAKGLIVTNDLSNAAYEYPAEMLRFSWNPEYSVSDKPETAKAYTLTVTADPYKYIEPSDYSFYHEAVGNTAAALTSTGTYTVRPVKPVFTGSTYNIFLGETAGDGEATSLANAVGLTIPDADISGASIPAEIKTALGSKLASYETNIIYSVEFRSPDDSPVYTNPLSGYSPFVNTTLYVTAEYSGITVGTEIPVVIKVAQGSLTITKTVTGKADPNQTFVFEIKQYSDAAKTKLVRIFYETIRVDSISNTGKVVDLPKGYYEVTEKSDWSWKYSLTSEKSVNDTLGVNLNGIRDIKKDSAVVSFTNVSKTVNWLKSIDWVLNKFVGGAE